MEQQYHSQEIKQILQSETSHQDLRPSQDICQSNEAQIHEDQASNTAYKSPKSEQVYKQNPNTAENEGNNIIADLLEDSNPIVVSAANSQSSRNNLEFGKN